MVVTRCRGPFLVEKVSHKRTVAPIEVGSFSHYLRDFIHPRWLFGISSINSSFVELSYFRDIFQKKTERGVVILFSIP